MSDLISIEQIKQWFSEAYDLDELDDLKYCGKGEVLDFSQVPDFQITVEDNTISREYDSYGSSTQDGLVVFSVTDLAGSSKLFKIPYHYESFQGGEWLIDQIAEVRKTSRIITTWEWTNV